MGMNRLEGKACLVTGAASGIGQGTAIRLAAEGGQVVCTDVNTDGLAKTVATIEEADGTAWAVECNVASEEAVKATIEGAIEKMGKLDVLANVAGVGKFVHSHQESKDNWDKTIAVNLTGTFLTCRYAIEHLLESKGAIVNVASIAGVMAHPYAAAYCASKGGVIMLTKALAMEYGAQGVRINAVCPGGIKTPFLKGFKPLPDGNINLLMRMMAVTGTYGSPAEVAALIAHLASDEARFCTGAVYNVDGGSTL